MASFSAHFEEKTGFDRIRGLLLERCFSPLGRKQVHAIGFSTDPERIRTLLNQGWEFCQILLGPDPFPGSGYFDPEDLFRELRIRGTYAEPEILIELQHSLETMEEVIRFMEKRDGGGELKFPWLARLTSGMEPERDLLRQLDRILDEKARVRSSASPALAEIRRSKASLEERANRRIEQILSLGKSQGWISQDTGLSLRGGRQVIPVAAAHKRRIRGFVHDQSATGQTVFLEPEEVFELNNQVHELELDERQEVVRILKAFADELRPAIPRLEAGYDMLAHMDAFRARARLALEMEAQKPRISDRPVIHWVRARHPLLYLAYKPQKKHVEPLDLDLDQENRILIISGPNAGGKSVCLKTCGLLQYMVQCGLLVPMTDYSEMGIFRSLFIDIGDEQSLENDLSTYSSHLLHMKFILEHCNDKSLFLIDEFGSGTEPRIGGAIAEALLEELNARKAFGLVTTHYANLKLMAGRQEGIQNGSMLFDTRHMRPLFRLKAGSPGSSFAFEIARTIGLPARVLDKAATFIGNQDLDFDKQLQDLEVKKLELEQKEKELRSAEAFLTEMIGKYEDLSRTLEGRKSDILQQSRQEARKILSDANRIIEKTIRDIKEAQASKEETRKAREALKAYREQQEADLKATEKKAPPPGGPVQLKAGRGPVRVGDTVRVSGQQTPGEVMEISGEQAVVSFGSIKFRTQLTKLEKLEAGQGHSRPTVSRTRLDFNINEKAAEYNPEADLRGLRVEEALSRLRLLVDDGILLGIKQVRILHGKGDGILRQAVRQYLQNVPEVQRFRDEHPDRGGAGITIADFR